MPTETDVEIAESLGALRAEVAERSGRLGAELAEFRGAVEAELGLIRKLGDRVLGAMVAGVGATVVWAALAGWYGSAIVAEVRQHGRAIEGLQSELKQRGARLDAIDRKLDTLLGRAAPAPKAGG